MAGLDCRATLAMTVVNGTHARMGFQMRAVHPEHVPHHQGGAAKIACK